MYPVICNKCFLIRDVTVTRQYFISKCGHMFCETCKSDVCVVCGKPYVTTLIEADMPSTLASYFASPMKAYKHFQKVVQFQTQQDALFLNYCVNSLPKRLATVYRRLEGVSKIDNRLTEKLAEKKRRIAKLKEYVAYHKRRSEQPLNLEPPMQVGILHRRHGAPVMVERANMLPKPTQFLRPQTPTLSTISRTFTNSESFVRNFNNFSAISYSNNERSKHTDFTL